MKIFFYTDKEILRDVHGEFRGCELTAVLGQSGSGKTSLLNILSGYTTKNVSGAVRLNGRDDVREIRDRSKFIMQNYTLHDFITVKEAMTFAANLKLYDVNSNIKSRKVSENWNWLEASYNDKHAISSR